MPSNNSSSFPFLRALCGFTFSTTPDRSQPLFAARTRELGAKANTEDLDRRRPLAVLDRWRIHRFGFRLQHQQNSLSNLALLDGPGPDPFPHLAFLHPQVGPFCRLFHAEPAPVPRLASDAARCEPFWLVDSMRMYRFFYDHARRQLRRMAPNLFAITYRNRE